MESGQKLQPGEASSLTNGFQTCNFRMAKSEETRTLNRYLESIKLKINQDANILNDSDLDITAEQLKNCFNGIKVQPKTLVAVFEENNRLIKLKENQKYSHSTVRQYNTTLSRLKEFLLKEDNKCQKHI